MLFRSLTQLELAVGPYSSFSSQLFQESGVVIYFHVMGFHDGCMQRVAFVSCV